MLISVKDLSKSFEGTAAVRSLSLDVGSGELVGFVGANGGGKTTSMRLLAGLMVPDSGAGTILGEDLSARRGPQTGIGYMPQSLALYDRLSVSENLRFRAKAYHLDNPETAVTRALQTFHLTPYAGARAATLSGGWRRRLQLAATLIHRPRLILLDEPTAGLDATARQDVWRHIEQLREEGTGVIIATHDLADAERCDRIVFLVAGHQVYAGPVAGLLASVQTAALHIDAPLRTLSGLRSEGGIIDAYARDGGVRLLVDQTHLSAVTATLNAQPEPWREVPLSLEDATIALCQREIPHV